MNRAEAPDLGALFGAIVTQPDDDGPRLVYADVLAERGDPRGELIVAQCMIARGGASDAILDREAALLARHGRDWLRELGVPAGTFRRGFLEVASLTAKAFLRARAQLERGAVLRELRLERLGPGELADVLGSPALSCLTRLTLHATPSFRLGPDEGHALAACPHLRRLEHLDVSGHPIGARAVGSLLRLPKLRHLVAHGCEIHDGAALESEEIEALDLSANPLPARDLVAVARALPRLVELRASDTPLGARGLADLVAARPELRRLSLPGCALEGAALDELAPLDLEELTLFNNAIGERGVAAIARARYAATLRSLDLGMIAVGDAVLGALAGARLPALRDLGLVHAAVTSRGAGALVRSTLPAQLEHLALGNNELGTEGALLLASVEWPRLRHVELEGEFDATARSALRKRFRSVLAWSY